jgi:site-specific DNA-methyltransferase (adenine-specific)
LSYELINDCCLNALPKLEDNSVDLVLVDLPYGTTQCKWDQIIPLEALWKEYNRVAKQNAAMIFTASQPFTSVLISSNIKNFKYCWVWEKSKATGYLNAKKMPMRAHEDVCVFYRKPPVYNPQMWQGSPYNKGQAHRPTDVYGKQVSVLVKNDTGLRYPRTVQYFKTAESEGKALHPTQKPVALMQYLIETYSNEGEVVLDNTMGSGTTGVAALLAKRKFIGMESDKEYFNLAKKRIEASL